MEELWAVRITNGKKLTAFALGICTCPPVITGSVVMGAVLFKEEKDLGKVEKREMFLLISYKNVEEKKKEKKKTREKSRGGRWWHKGIYPLILQFRVRWVVYKHM